MGRSRRDGAVWARIARRGGTDPAVAEVDAEYLSLDPATGALIVTGAGAAPTATALRVQDGDSTRTALVGTDRALLVRDVSGSGVEQPLTDAQLRAVPVPVDTGLAPQKDALTDAQLRATAVPVTFTATDSRSLTERMFAKAPLPGFSLWLDTADASFIYLAEAPMADPAAAITFAGVRVMKDASGNPLGKVQQASGFAWAARAEAAWS